MKKKPIITEVEWKCKNCIWQKPETRRCHLNPPTIVNKEFNNSCVSRFEHFEHPVVADDDCCSHFEERITKSK